MYRRPSTNPIGARRARFIATRQQHRDPSRWYDDPLFGFMAYGGTLASTGPQISVVPRDGLRQRFAVVGLGGGAVSSHVGVFRLELDRDGFAAGALGDFASRVVYANGQGVPRDYVESHMWVNLAATQTAADKRAEYAQARDEIAKAMTPDQVAEAQKRAREWLAAFERLQK